MNPFSVPLGEKISVSHPKKKLIVLAGPTGVGKTKISLKIAQVLGGEIISADSMQVYRGMDIGTAKVKPEERGSIRHHLIDSRDLDETYNVVEFFNESQQALREIYARDHVPLVVGGTGFYIQALMYGPPQGPASVPHIRHQLQKEMDEKGAVALFERLKTLDPEYAKTITFRDRHKIIRALEIMSLSDQKVSSFIPSPHPSEEYDFRCWFLYMPKEQLYPLIEQRCDQMIAEGFVEEVKKLQNEGLCQNSSASQAIGYRQCLEFLNTQQAADDWLQFIQKFKQASRRYAKRQFTWYREKREFCWINVHKLGFDHTIEMILQDYERR